MDSFARSCACEGRKPSMLHIAHCRLRLGLLAKMMRDRGAVRFVSAPRKFGKSAAAFGYAESIFRLENAFWMPANDPRFLRDLDEDTLADYLLAASPRPSLLVLDDLPYLHIERSEKLSRMLELLLSRGWEAVVTALPSHDCSEMLTVPVMRLGVDDLLLDDGEAADLGSAAAPSLGSDAVRARKSASARIPCLAWGSPDERRAFPERVLDEEMPSEVLFAHISLLVLRRGALSDVLRLQRAESPSVLSLIASLYPHLGVDLHHGTFDASCIPEEDALRAARTHFQRAAAAVRGMDAGSWARDMADALLARGESRSACATVLELCDPAEREAWLSVRQGDLARRACVAPASTLADSVFRVRANVSAEVRAGQAWRLLWAGKTAQAEEQAEAVAQDSAAPDAARLSAGILLEASRGDGRALPLVVRLAGYGTLDMEKALDAARAACCEAESMRRAGSASERSLREAALRWAALSLAAARTEKGGGLVLAKRQMETALSLRGAEFAELSCAIGAVAFDAAVRLRRHGGLSRAAREAVDGLRPLARKAFLRAADEGACGLFALQLAENAAVPSTELAEWGVPRRFVVELERLRKSLKEQRAAASEDEGPRRPHAPAAFAEARVPRLRMRLFGGMDAMVGSRRVDPKLFRRRKVQAIAGILAIAHGKEVSVDYLEDSLWPSSASSRARNNFYNSWSQLRRAFELAPRECPYLVRLQNSCRMEPSLVDTDVDEFLALCDRVQFSVPDPATLPTLFARIERLYAGDLLPSEQEHPAIVSYRAELRNRLVDALVAASTCARTANELPVALQAARAALRHDEGREDAYNALIKAQTAAGQRSNAIATYFQCRSYLKEKLGMDPSPQTAALYQRLLIDEAPIGEQLSLPI